MIYEDTKKPKNPNFSSGPTRKPDGWSVKKLNTKYLGRYHRSEDVREYVEKIILNIKKTLKIPKDYKIFFTWILYRGNDISNEFHSWKKRITSIIYDYWGLLWSEELKKLKYKVNSKKELTGKLPSLENIPTKDDVVFVWNATSNGMSISNIDFITKNHLGLVISDLTSAVFVCDLPWQNWMYQFFLSKRLLELNLKGVAVLSPKALERIKTDQLKLFSLKNFDFLVNTPSLLAFADLELCIDLYNKRGGLSQNIKICKANKKFLDEWEKKNNFVSYFALKKNQSITPSFFYL